MRYGLAAVVLAPFVLRRGLRWPAGMRQWGAIVLTGFLIQCIYVSLAYLAMKRGMDAGTAVIIMALQPILVGALLPLLGARSSGAWLWPGLGLGFAGVVVAILPGTALGPGPLVAVLFAVAALSASPPPPCSRNGTGFGPIRRWEGWFSMSLASPF